MPRSGATDIWSALGVGLMIGFGLGAPLGLDRAGAVEQGAIRMSGKTSTVYDFTLNDIDGKPVSLSQFKGKVIMLVNTASFCGNTPQYADLEKMYETYRDKGFEILAFPANNFGQQEPGTNEEIKGFCLTKYSVGFPLFSKISVKGGDKHPLYQYLTEQSPFPGEVEWNFQKYLVDRSGNVVARYHHRTKPLADEVVRDVEQFLART
ncbi:MAG: glutathione peroxidase [Nitrospira sp.]|nr:MAG: glutathione peroxidase [Nitrospira sp.]